MPQEFRDNRGRVTGVLRGDTYYKSVKGSIHLMRKLNAWGVDTSIINTLAPSTKIHITDTETGMTYCATVEKFLRKGIRHNFGHGLQLFLPKDFFTTGDEILQGDLFQ